MLPCHTLHNMSCHSYIYTLFTSGSVPSTYSSLGPSHQVVTSVAICHHLRHSQDTDLSVSPPPYFPGDIHIYTTCRSRA
ncbi:hypothetical protein XENTR_v10001287 [Xenopus tropicalis]|nr:hypothetical protein XENTR_v10001287 [Xenopus tropicalis]